MIYTRNCVCPYSKKNGNIDIFIILYVTRRKKIVWPFGRIISPDCLSTIYHGYDIPFKITIRYDLNILGGSYHDKYIDNTLVKTTVRDYCIQFICVGNILLFKKVKICSEVQMQLQCTYLKGCVHPSMNYLLVTINSDDFYLFMKNQHSFITNQQTQTPFYS